MIRSVIREDVVAPPDIPNSQTFWHGGNLDSHDSSIAHRKSRVEYGPGLYLTTHYGTAQKYARGGRKLYMVTVQNGVDMNNASLPMEAAKKFISQFVIGSKRRMVMERLMKFEKSGGVSALIFNNVMINEDAVKPSNMNALRQFYVDNGIDYIMVDSPFGWHEKMMVLFDMKKILKVRRILPTDKVEVFDLH